MKWFGLATPSGPATTRGGMIEQPLTWIARIERPSWADSPHGTRGRPFVIPLAPRVPLLPFGGGECVRSEILQEVIEIAPAEPCNHRFITLCVQVLGHGRYAVISDWRRILGFRTDKQQIELELDWWYREAHQKRCLCPFCDGTCVTRILGLDLKPAFQVACVRRGCHFENEFATFDGGLARSGL